VLFGAQWHVIEISTDYAVVEFRTCTGELSSMRRPTPQP
jgi:hypothetical protein